MYTISRYCLSYIDSTLAFAKKWELNQMVDDEGEYEQQWHNNPLARGRSGNSGTSVAPKI